MDIENILFGVDFRTHIRKELSDCQVLLENSRQINRNCFAKRCCHNPVLIGNSTMPKPEQLPDSLIDQILKALEEARRIEAERSQAERLRHAEEERHRAEIDRQEAATRRAEEAAARKRFQEEQARRAEEIAQEARLAREARHAGELKQNSRNNWLEWRRLRNTRSGGASINPRSRRLLADKG